jgi:hypothetical protein
MSAMKRPVSLPVYEELRELNTLADDADKTFVDRWMTPEFWTMVSTAATNLLAVAVLIGWVNSDQVEGLGKAVTALIGATEVIVVNTVLVWKYIAGRNEIKAQMLDAKYRYMEAIAVERLRSREKA